MPAWLDRCRRLGSLNHTVVAAEYILSASVLVDVAKGIGNVIYRDGCILLACRFVAFIDYLCRYERAHAIVETYHAVFCIRNQRQSVLG